jgi:hypothetical protein
LDFKQRHKIVTVAAAAAAAAGSASQLHNLLPDMRDPTTLMSHLLLPLLLLPLLQPLPPSLITC